MDEILGFSINRALLEMHLSKSKASGVETAEPVLWIMYMLYDMRFDSRRVQETLSSLTFSGYRELFPGNNAGRQYS
jgi:hypothetical protein